jgi:hypothetical protein
MVKDPGNRHLDIHQIGYDVQYDINPGRSREETAINISEVWNRGDEHDNLTYQDPLSMALTSNPELFGRYGQRSGREPLANKNIFAQYTYDLSSILHFTNCDTQAN